MAKILELKLFSLISRNSLAYINFTSLINLLTTINITLSSAIGDIKISLLKGNHYIQTPWINEGFEI